MAEHHLKTALYDLVKNERAILDVLRKPLRMATRYVQFLPTRYQGQSDERKQTRTLVTMQTRREHAVR